MGPLARIFALLLVAVLVLTAPAEAKTKQRRTQSLDREIKSRRGECEHEMKLDARCGSSQIDFDNCVLRCISETCYDSVYGADALEEGEVDIVRGRTFRSCARNELRNLKVAENQRSKDDAKRAGSPGEAVRYSRPV